MYVNLFAFVLMVYCIYIWSLGPSTRNDADTWQAKNYLLKRWLPTLNVNKFIGNLKIMNKGRKKDFSTLIIIGKHQQKSRSITLATKYIIYLKYYITSVICTGLMIIGVIIFLCCQLSKNQREKRILYSKMAKLIKEIPTPEDQLAKIDAENSARAYVQNIEATLKKVSIYLRKRGIKYFALDARGGSNNKDFLTLSAIDMYASYNEHLNKVFYNLSFTPIGKPGNFSITSSEFGYRVNPFSTGRIDFHTGVDLKGAAGDVVRSTAHGKVVYAGWFQGYGNCVRVQHKNGYETLYAHLSKIKVSESEFIGPEKVIGTVGSTGRSTGNHLHYEVRKNGKPLNPRNFFNL